MQDAKLYEELAAHLDQGIVGSPKSPALIEILKILFPGEEADSEGEPAVVFTASEMPPSGHGDHHGNDLHELPDHTR